MPKWHQPRSASILGGVGAFLAGLCDGHFPYFAILHDSFPCKPSIRPDVLHIDGYYIDRVVALSGVIHLTVLEALPIEEIRSQLFGTSFSLFSP